MFFLFSFRAEQLTVSQLFKKVIFEKNRFDPINWQPIDDKIVTEIHEKHQILPCAFPHRDYFMKNNIKSMTGTAQNPAQPNVRVAQQRKIKPRDDSKEAIRRVVNRNNSRLARLKELSASRKKSKMLRRNMRRKAKSEKAKIEDDGLTEAKNDFASRMDQYNTINDSQLNDKKIEQESDSIASRTRRRFKPQSGPSESPSESPKVLYTVRRSDRVTKNK